MIIWILFVILSSILEALMFHRKIFIYNIHIYLTLIRGLVCIPLSVQNEWLPFLIFCLFTFPFIHDGIYYTTRHLLNKNVYPKMFFDRSTTTTAIISLSIFWRLILFIFGLGLLPVVL